MDAIRRLTTRIVFFVHVRDYVLSAVVNGVVVVVVVADAIVVAAVVVVVVVGVSLIV